MMTTRTLGEYYEKKKTIKSSVNLNLNQKNVNPNRKKWLTEPVTHFFGFVFIWLTNEPFTNF